MARPSPLRDERVSRRAGKPRAAVLPETPDEVVEEEDERPRLRRDCARVARPCPYVGCRHHLYLDVHPQTGAVVLNFPELAPEELRHSCSLDRADLGEHTLEDVGALLNFSRERARQVQDSGLARIVADPEAGRALRDLLEELHDRERRGD